MVLAESPPQASTHATILLIDDDEADLRHWSDTVRNLASNYTVLNALDCNSGLAICRDQTVDCVLLDLDMPDSGFRALLELVPDRNQPSIAVVILTRLIHPALGEMTKHNGAQAWLVKQHTSAEDLDTTIQQAISSVNSTRERRRTLPLHDIQFPMDTSSRATTLLLIDGNSNDRSYWAARLRMSSPDCVILEAKDGETGLAMCRSQRVDCVISEIHLPDMSGFRVLTNLIPRARSPERAVIILSRVTFSSLADLAIKNGAHSYLMKPFVSGDDLDKAIHRALAAVGPRKEPAH